MSDLMNRLLKSVKTSPMAAVMTESKVFKEREIECPTGIHVLDIALSGRHGGGVQPGVTMLAAPSKHAKTYFALILVSAYLRKYPDAVCYFLDSELGAGMKYFEATRVDPARVIHVPVGNVENAKFELLSALNAIERGEHVIYLYDSLGNTASKKETDDATDGKAVADMSRAKAIKSFFRIVTPEVNMKNVPLVVVNHVYMEVGLFPKTITSGGSGSTLACDTIFHMTRAKVKEGTDVAGYTFNFKIEKSRYCREEMRFPIVLTYEGGVNPYSGLLDFAIETGYVVKPSQGWFSRKNIPDDKKWRRDDTDSIEFWQPMLEDEEFVNALVREFALVE